MTQLTYRAGTLALVAVAAIVFAPQTGNTQSLTLGPTQGATRLLGNDQWDIYYFERGDAGYDPATSYNYLVARQEIGDSQLTQAARKGFFNRFLQGLGWKDTDLASISVKSEGLPAELTLLTVQKDASDSLLKPNADDWRISGLKSYLPGNALGVTISLKGGNHVESTIVENALSATKAVAGALGGGPAVKTIDAIPKDAIKALDTFAERLAGGTSQAAPAISIDGIKLKRRPVYEFIFFDKPKTNNGKVVAKITVSAKNQPSLFGMVGTNSGPSFFNAVLHTPLDGKTEQDGGASLYKGLQSGSLFTNFSSERYDQYYQLCDQLPGYLSGLGLVPFDVTLAHYAFLAAAKGGGAARTGGLGVCPGEAVAAEMRKLGFSPLPAELLDENLKTQREKLRKQQNALFGKIASALAQAQSQGIKDLCQGTVMLWQSVKVFPDVALTKDVARGNDEIGDLFSALAKGTPNSVKISDFDYNGEGQLSGHAILRVVRSAADTDRYRISIVLNNDNQIQRIAIDPSDS